MHEEHKVKEEWDDKREEWKRDWDDDREEISEAGRNFGERVHEDEQSAFRKVAETEGEYKAYEEEGYEGTLEDDYDDDGDY